MPSPKIPAFFHPDQLSFRPRYEWAFGERIEHPERTERADKILEALRSEPQRFSVQEPDEQPLNAMRCQHDANMLRLFKTASSLEPGETYYPTVFLSHDSVTPDPTQIHHAGYYCFDAGTPLSAEVANAALWSAASARSAAKEVRSGNAKLAYALSRPPGHHASYDTFGGYCYFNNAAAAALVLRTGGRIAILDIDVHHGNGTQSLFYRVGEVLTVSIHSDPRYTFPYFSGLDVETGAGPGKGTNMNIVLPEGTDGQTYEKALVGLALKRIQTYAPAAIVVAAGVDAYYADPVGTFGLQTEDFYRIGELIGSLGIPTCVVQEGGYYTPAIGDNVLAVLGGLREGLRL